MLALGLAQLARAPAGPPMLTDDPGTSAKGTRERNTALGTQHNRDGSSETLLPMIDLSYGLTENTEFSLESHWAIVREPGASAKAGWDDTTLGFKWRFWEEEKNGVDLAFQPQFTFNTGSSAYRRGLVAKNSDLLIPFELGKAFGPVVLNLEIGRDFHSQHAIERDFWFAGLTLGHAFSKEFEGIVELYLPETSRTFTGGTLLLNLGGRYKLNESCSLLFSSGTGLSGEARPKFIAYYGLQMVF